MDGCDGAWKGGREWVGGSYGYSDGVRDVDCDPISARQVIFSESFELSRCSGH